MVFVILGLFVGCSRSDDALRRFYVDGPPLRAIHAEICAPLLPAQQERGVRATEGSVKVEDCASFR